MTQDELARRVGMTRTSITNIEHGRQKVQLHTLYDIAAALDVPAQDLLPAARVAAEAIEDRLPEELTAELTAAEQQWAARLLVGGSG
jgi:transcriptional regulator with XRE-family HTH domain